MDADWIEHRREDGERLGWIRMVGEQFIAVDVLGREITGEVDWLEAEETLDERGLGFLAERWLFDSPVRGTVFVRIVEASPAGVRVREDDFGAAAAAGAEVQDHDLPFPAPATLRPGG
ncbi:hypothetical protein [Garicola koreensis]|uniref:Uncharacterized protein n=1 Tax=Garicola koreensis TaxID=1262554 RepID=A0A7W5XYG5_9MICC|nr:hypothetical protein [Garicola koreensis]MBB3666471.1 hypothetical protein [Garicola koreensis]